jgi:hypothetical protein
VSHTVLYRCSEAKFLQESNLTGSYRVDNGVAGQRRLPLNWKVAHIVSPQTKEAKIHI